MSIRTKLFSFYVVFILCLAGLVKLWAEENLYRIEFGKKEQVGISQLTVLHTLETLNSELATDANYARASDEFKISLNRLSKSLAESGYNSAVPNQLTQLSRKADQKNWGQPVEDEIARLRSQVGDQSNLILDPDLDSYYLMDIGLLRLPATRTRLDKLSRTPPSPSEAIAESASLDIDIEGLKNSEKVVRRELRIREHQLMYSLLVEHYIDSIRSLQDALKSGDTVKSRTLARNILAEGDTLQSTTLEVLNAVLEVRLDTLNGNRNRTFAILLMVLVPISILFFSRVQAIVSTIRYVSQELLEIKDNDFAELDRQIGSLTQGSTTLEFVNTTRAEAKPKLKGNELKIVVNCLQQMRGQLNRLFSSIELCRVQLAHARAEIAESERRFRTVADSLGEGLMLTDLEGNIVYCNHILPMMSGMTGEKSPIGKPAFETFFHPESAEDFRVRHANHIQGEQDRFEARLKTPMGTESWVRVTVTPFRDDSGEITGTLIVVSDINEIKIFEDQLEHQAFHDPLTSLPNRALFSDRLERATARYRRTGNDYAVMFIDLDNFKVVNDSLGHEAGDMLLVSVAERIIKCLRDTDTLARIGGDEFTILLEDLHEMNEVHIIASRILESMSFPINVGEQQLLVSMSIGVAYGAENVHSSVILRNADTAMYEAKSSGKRRYVIFDESMSVRAHERLKLEQDLREALKNGDITVAFQPIVDLKTNTVVELEALARWLHLDRGFVPPDKFIPVAEEACLIEELGAAVLRRACEEATTWPAQPNGIKPTVAVNVSQYQIHGTGFIEVVDKVLEETGLDPNRLKLEITESAMMNDAKQVVALMHELKKRGIRLAIDDFGTGYSSMAMLRDLPFDSLKVDRSFVSRVAEGKEEDDAIVRAILNLSESLNIYVVSEGVETEEQRNFLAAEGCELAQGYLYSKPLWPEDLKEFFKSNPGDRAA